MTRVYTRAPDLGRAYEECKHLIDGAVAGFLRRHAWDPEEARGHANLGFVKAFRDYDPKRSAFGQRVVYMCWAEMITAYARELRRKQRMPTLVLSHLKSNKSSSKGGHNVNPEETIPDPRRDFCLNSLKRLLDEDSAQVVDLAVALERGDRQALARALMERGWNGRRIVRAFRALQEALS